MRTALRLVFFLLLAVMRQSIVGRRRVASHAVPCALAPDSFEKLASSILRLQPCFFQDETHQASEGAIPTTRRTARGKRIVREYARGLLKNDACSTMRITKSMRNLG